MNMGLVWNLSPWRSSLVWGDGSGFRWEGFELGEDFFDRGTTWGMMPMI